MRIKEIIISKGVKSKELAKACGLSEMAISHILTGKSMPNAKTIINMATYLNVRCGELFDDYNVAGPDNTHSVIIDGVEYVPKN